MAVSPTPRHRFPIDLYPPSPLGRGEAGRGEVRRPGGEIKMIAIIASSITYIQRKMH
jgi:hypothetical protein